MKLPRLPLFVGLLLLPLGLAAAPGAVRKGAVTAELVAAQPSIQPGRSFRVALKLTHDEHWHSYWINAGTGYPTSLQWKLPAGFTAGSILWPTPHVLKDKHGRVTGHGYEGEVFLFVEISAPASLKPGEDVTLRAKADWLMCDDVCMPGGADLELTLPVGAETPALNASLAQAYTALPKPLTGWIVSAVISGKSLTLGLRPDAKNKHHPQGWHFFDHDGLIDYAAPQTVSEENGILVIDLLLAADAKTDGARLSGVLVSANGWDSGQASTGVLIDVPLITITTQSTPALVYAPQASVLTPHASAKGTLASTLLLALVGGADPQPHALRLPRARHQGARLRQPVRQ